ncbi:MAG: helix-turn-helix domain-containing protein [Acaryochloris sp. RU_4_1]|nr:helix-turn-helix domain-containing protein [Acaryochloris sp. RU_4_1]NJR55658.1 helix-turn-helix domain-containing protein [Acaryochloris sp. CRU_2_0]
MTVKILLKELRTARNLSQNKLARLLDMSPQNVQRIEYGEAKAIPLETLDKLCSVLDCQPGDILVWVDDDGDKDSSSNDEAILEQKPKGKKKPDSPLLTDQASSLQLSIVPDLAVLPESA